MTNKGAKAILQNMSLWNTINGDEFNALKQGMNALDEVDKCKELLNTLKDRPCSVCKNYKENGCCKWTCVFCDRLFGNMRGAE